MIKPEAALQVKINQWSRECVAVPHFFTGIDRSKRSGQFTHVREKARGLVAGTPDTVLLVHGLPSIWVELKAPGNHPTDQQYEVGSAIKHSGHVWDWCDTVEGYATILARRGVRLTTDAHSKAMHADALLAAAAIRREEASTGKPSAKRFARVEKKPTAAALKRRRSLNDKGIFV